MADLPAVGDYKVPNLHLTGINVEAIKDGDIPTDQQIVSEARILKQSREAIPYLNAADSAGANAEMQWPPLHPQLLLICQNIDAETQFQTQILEDMTRFQTQIREGMTQLQIQLQNLPTQLEEGMLNQLNMNVDAFAQMASQGVGSSSRSRKKPSQGVGSGSRSRKKPSQGVGSGLRRSERIRK
ncbi:translocon at the outer envelope membrane ofchloroplasts 75-III [Striga asiatica]|uniref:Translocon at the outer envelope membrane ofchloroplasts 75-III n=1 Tax=Striga asiatica TaxID=4170 RepID=A0A5A7PB55_STRAF|nr:translocon at the outer envelope membrane ofchloroplasts 75-III [Striga asiatica]